MATIKKYRGLETGGLDKALGIDSSTIAKYVGIDWSQFFLPSGIILPLRGAGAVPSGWSIFDNTDMAGTLYRYVIGAGSSYSPGDYASAVVGTLGSVAGGAHTPTGSSIGSGDAETGPTGASNHTHTTTLDGIIYPRYEAHRFITADADTVWLPPNACIFKHSSGGWTGLTREYPSVNATLMNHTVDGEAETATKAFTMASTGVHDHGGTSGITPAGGGAGAYRCTTVTGAHTHTGTGTITYYLKRRFLSMWYSAAASIYMGGQSGIIGMYQSVTPPTGWSLCDGSNGTPDMRDYFCGIPNLDSSAGTSEGNNTITITGTSTTSDAHDHYWSEGTCNSCPRAIDLHVLSQAGHSHALNHVAQSYMAQYSCLAFIMYTGV